MSISWDWVITITVQIIVNRSNFHAAFNFDNAATVATVQDRSEIELIVVLLYSLKFGFSTLYLDCYDVELKHFLKLHVFRSNFCSLKL